MSKQSFSSREELEVDLVGAAQAHWKSRKAIPAAPAMPKLARAANIVLKTG